MSKMKLGVAGLTMAEILSPSYNLVADGTLR